MGKTVTFCPSLWGGKDWPPAAYNPQTGLLYIPAHENLCSTLQGKTSTPTYEPGKRFVGMNPPGRQDERGSTAPIIFGELQAWDLKTGQKVWDLQVQVSELGAGVDHGWRVSVLAVARTTGISGPLMPKTARCCGNSAPTLV